MDIKDFKIKFNYYLCNLRRGELYVTTSKYVKSTPEQMEKVQKCMEDLNLSLETMRKMYKDLTGEEMNETVFEKGFAK